MVGGISNPISQVNQPIDPVGGRSVSPNNLKPSFKNMYGENQIGREVAQGASLQKLPPTRRSLESIAEIALKKAEAAGDVDPKVAIPLLFAPTLLRRESTQARARC